MTVHAGYLLIADISGYTSFLTSSELAHANPILRSLLGAMVEQIGDPLHLWRMDGDAVLAYSTDQEFPTGEAFLTLCEGLYNRFAAQRQDIIANTTCPCNACANVRNLDLKILAHYGEFEEMQVGPIKDISGPDVILVHRMAKTDVKEKTGVRSYAMFTEAALARMEIPDDVLVDYKTSFEHFGEVKAGVYDLAAAWEGARAQRERQFLAEEDGIWSFHWQFDATPQLLWEMLTDVGAKARWMLLRGGVTATHEGHRLGKGTRYHCIHEVGDFFYTIVDWEPPHYFSTRLDTPIPGVYQRETYALTPNSRGTALRYTMGAAFAVDGTPHPEIHQPSIDFLSQYWRDAFSALDALLAERKARLAASAGEATPAS